MAAYAPLRSFPYSTTSSARASKDCGMVNPIAADHTQQATKAAKMWEATSGPLDHPGQDLIAGPGR
jgi:hypothetical protein